MSIGSAGQTGCDTFPGSTRYAASDHLRTLFRDDPSDPAMLKVTIKINNTDLKHIIATLERFDYKIIAKFEEQVNKDDSMENLDVLMKYLNI